MGNFAQALQVSIAYRVCICRKITVCVESLLSCVVGFFFQKVSACHQKLEKEVSTFLSLVKNEQNSGR